MFKTGDIVTVNLANTTIKCNATGKVFKFKPLGDAKDVIDSGGLFNFARSTGMISQAK
jgi:3-isopropylmalate/(R)-2-methylmalate dehydratase small subunit